MTTSKPSVLGRGIASLLGPTPYPRAARPNQLPLEVLQPGASQPRRTFYQESLEELSASIRSQGVLQPILVRPLAVQGDVPRYEIVAGERRWQAARLAGLTEIPVVIRALTDQQAVLAALIENIQREQLTAAEEARALQRLIAEFSLTHAQVAEAVGRSRAAVSNLVRLLDLPPLVVELIDNKQLSMGHARALLGLTDEAERVRLAQLFIERACSVREAESWVRRALTGTPPARRASVMSHVMRNKSVRVRVRHESSGAGRLVIDFGNAASYDQLLQAISGVLKLT